VAEICVERKKLGASIIRGRDVGEEVAAASKGAGAARFLFHPAKGDAAAAMVMVAVGSIEFVGTSFLLHSRGNHNCSAGKACSTSS